MQPPPTDGTGTEVGRPVGSTTDAIWTLRELSWRFTQGPMKRVRTYGMYLLIAVVVSVWTLYPFLDGSSLDEDAFFHLYITTFILGILIAFILIFHVAWLFHRATRNHMMRRLHLGWTYLVEKEVGRSIEECGLAFNKTTVVAGPSPLQWLLRVLDKHDTMYVLPELGATVILADEYRKDAVGDHAIYIGPVTDDNAGGIVRLVEALERRFEQQGM